MRKVKITAVVIILLSVAYFILSFTNRLTGTVVDAETGKPIEGAVVLVEWTMTKGIGLTYTTSYKVKEMVTDKNGQFTVYAVPNPLVDAPDVTIYKKGYVAWSNKWIFPDSKKRTDFQWGHYVFKLDSFKKEYSYIKHTSFIHRAINLGLGTNKQLMTVAYYWEELEASKERDIRRK